MKPPHQVDLFRAVEASQGTPSGALLKQPQVPAESPQAPAMAAQLAPRPWENPTERAKSLNFNPDDELHAKMNWVCDNVPKMSRSRILRDGATAECDRLIALHYKR